MLLSIPSQVGYGALFTAVFAESAGVPLPGETSLLAGGVLAGRGDLNLLLVIGLAAVTGPAGAVAIYVTAMVAAGGGVGALALSVHRRRRSVVRPPDVDPVASTP